MLFFLIKKKKTPAYFCLGPSTKTAQTWRVFFGTRHWVTASDPLGLLG